MKAHLALWSGLGLLVVAVSTDLPTETSTLFAGAGRCADCHSASASLDGPMRDQEGTDISPVTLWRSSVMANAARDPVWQAKVAAEVSEFPALQSIIEDKCNTCHAPMGRTEAVFHGADAFSFAQALADPLSMDGVSCTLCHQIQPSNLGSDESFSGGYSVDDSRTIYGPYDNVLSAVMESAVNYTAVQGAHLSGSELCASCHTLFTPTIDNTGQIVGEIAEQTPYLEWLNSKYPAEGVECQTCHLPETELPTAISTIPQNLPERGPFSRHLFVGGNATLLKMLRTNGESIGVTAEAVHFDSTLVRTLRQLQNRTASLSATYAWPYPDTLEVTIRVHNRTGHKFPTGFPSRRAWIHVRVQNSGGEQVFESGGWSEAEGDIAGLDEPFEPHYDLVRHEEDVVVYQSLMGDVDGNLTWILLRGDTYLKDNRIPPEGFTSTGAAYDTTAIRGLAAADPNFNLASGVQGTGSDEVTYRIGGLSQNTPYSMFARLRYQSLSPGFVEQLQTYSGTEADRFDAYYAATDISPTTIDSVNLVITATTVSKPEFDAGLKIGLYPNPASQQITITISDADGPITVHLYDLLGRVVAKLRATPAGPGRAAVVHFGTSHIPDGVYVYGVESAGTRRSGKLMVIR